MQAQVKPHLLVVEDDTNLLEGVQSVLELEGYFVTTAVNGVHALQWLYAEESRPDLIISDIMMPQMDGLQFLHEVRKDPRFTAIPFIFLTARGEKSDIHRGKRMGVDDYIVKPFDTDDLLIAVESRLRRHEALQAVQVNAIAAVKHNILNVLNHEFRTPLTYIVAYADMLNQPEALSHDEILSFLHGVNSGAVRLRRLVENFIQLVELQSGETERTYLSRRAQIDNVREIVNLAQQQASSNYAERSPNVFQIDIEPGLPPFIADAELLRVAVTQLLDNAIKFSRVGATIKVTARSRDGQVFLSVADGGRGVTPEEQEKIWDMFYQINRAYYEDQGAGSGLAIVKGIAQVHGGYVELESQTGRGSTFTMVIPILEPALVSAEDGEHSYAS
ncbi:MAG: response regulator [Anaerolineae bacterium]|nr:response regulator [Anaerolineae bacterium]MCA9908045.1 response regulator [Anaerolineae bacterium]